MKNLVMYVGCRRTKLYIWRKWVPTWVSVKCILHIKKFRLYRKIPKISETFYCLISDYSDSIGKFLQNRKIPSALYQIFPTISENSYNIRKFLLPDIGKIQQYRIIPTISENSCCLISDYSHNIGKFLLFTMLKMGMRRNSYQQSLDFLFLASPTAPPMP